MSEGFIEVCLFLMGSNILLILLLLAELYILKKKITGLLAGVLHVLTGLGIVFSIIYYKNYIAYNIRYIDHWYELVSDLFAVVPPFIILIALLILLKNLLARQRQKP
jgi:hypothetical protein